jgi:hypothetical protein
MMGSASEASSKDTMASPTVFDTGKVKRVEGRRMSGCGRATVGRVDGIFTILDMEGKDYIFMESQGTGVCVRHVTYF